MDLAAGWLHTGSKTDAGRDRVVKIRGALRDELLTLRAGRGSIDQDAYVFATGRGGRMSDDNFRSRAPRGCQACERENLERAYLPPLPDKLTPHSLRRTFCSLLYALGEDPGTVMDEMGHTDPALALRVYRQSMRRGEDEKAQMLAPVEGGVWANMGERSDVEASATTGRRAA
jgi:integrase